MAQTMKSDLIMPQDVDWESMDDADVYIEAKSGIPEAAAELKKR